ncbi:hypothetical protein Hanom_Chr15g01361571 [Helianthus anomalus]
MNSLNFMLTFRMFFLRLHFPNYGMVGIGEPMGIRVLSGVHFREVLAYFLPLCNEDTGPVTPCSDFSGCDTTFLPFLCIYVGFGCIFASFVHLSSFNPENTKGR